MNYSSPDEYEAVQCTTIYDVGTSGTIFSYVWYDSVVVDLSQHRQE